VVGDPAVTDEKSKTPKSKTPNKDKNHRQGIAGGFGGLS
jgi:hypothetical protein